MPHPLDGCRAKLVRAEELWDELGASLVAFLDQGPYQHEDSFDGDTGEWVVRFRVLAEPPLRWGVLIGDIVHNLRSALDHLAWQLVLLNGLVPSWRTQFPIYSDEAGYRRANGGQAQVEGMNEADKERIEERQPFHVAGETLEQGGRRDDCRRRERSVV